MKWRALAWLAAGALFAPCAASAGEGGTREWRFEVSLDGRRIGEHRFVLREGRYSRELTSEAQFRVRLLFIDAYRYEHRARESWQDGCLVWLDAHTNVNGTHVEITGERDGDGFRLKTAARGLPLGDCVQTFAYWNPNILEARRLLNPQTGEYVEVKVMPMGREVVAGQQTQRFRLLGNASTPLEIDLWYTPARDWVALESTTPEGRRLRYARK